MTACHGCHQDLEPLAATRTYHGQCDPRGRVEYLERILRGIVARSEEAAFHCVGEHDAFAPHFQFVLGAARAALAKAKAPQQQLEG